MEKKVHRREGYVNPRDRQYLIFNVRPEGLNQGAAPPYVDECARTHTNTARIQLGKYTPKSAGTRYQRDNSLKFVSCVLESTEEE